MSNVTVLKTPTKTGESVAVGRRIKLVSLLRLSEKMVECAQQKDWDSLDRLESRRRVELEDCFSGKTEERESPLIAEAIATLVHLNEQLVNLVSKARTQAMAESSQYNTTKTAVNTYLSAENSA